MRKTDWRLPLIYTPYIVLWPCSVLYPTDSEYSPVVHPHHAGADPDIYPGICLYENLFKYRFLGRRQM